MDVSVEFSLYGNELQLDGERKKIMNLIEDCCSKSISKNLKTFQSKGHYAKDFNNEEIKKKVNDLFKKYGNFLDSTREKFKSKFQSNYGECIFELVMASFINCLDSFSLQKDHLKWKMVFLISSLNLKINYIF